MFDCYAMPGTRTFNPDLTLLLAAGLVLGATSAAKAVDFKMTGLWQNRVSFADPITATIRCACRCPRLTRST